MIRSLLITFCLLVMIPFNSFAFEKLTDSQMKKETGAAGVQIAVDDVILQHSKTTVKFIDSDGNGAANDAAGAITIKHEPKTVEINFIFPDGQNSAAQGLHATKHDYSMHFSGSQQDIKLTAPVNP